MKKKTIVVHSGGMDSSICLALAIEKFGKDNVLSLSFHYGRNGQRHSNEIVQAKKICQQWGVDHHVLYLDFFSEITDDALVNSQLAISGNNTLVSGRNGLMARIASIHAGHLGAHCIYMGIIELDSQTTGYRDCSRAYIDLKQQIMRLDLDDPHFEILTPLVKMNKKETLEEAHRLGILEFLLKETITCYEGIPLLGCKKCLSCTLRNEGLRHFIEAHPAITLPYAIT